MVAAVPAGTVPRPNITIPFAFELPPCDELKDIRLTPAGTMLLTTTPFAEDGPLFVTVNVYVKLLPTSTGSGASDTERARSSGIPPPAETKNVASAYPS